MSGAPDSYLRAVAFDLADLEIEAVRDEAHTSWVGRSIGEIAEEQGKTPFDAMIDLTLSEDLKTSFSPMTGTDDKETWQLRSDAWHDDRTVIGASAASASRASTRMVASFSILSSTGPLISSVRDSRSNLAAC